VDFETRDRLLSDLLQASSSTDRHALIQDLLQNSANGQIKLFVTATALRYRRDHARLFLDGAYRPLNGFGVRERHLFSFARTYEDKTVVAVVPRLVVGLLPEPFTLPLGNGVWGDTRLELPAAAPGAIYRNLFTGETVRPVPVEGRPMCAIAEVLATFPVALLERLP
jgi:(1->4)-alpha-D-glucan 1-alpha-D-glucosylmutase